MDSRPATLEHIGHVQEWLKRVIENISHRSKVHDLSKLESPEVEIFDEFTPKLKDSVYGSDEYKEFLKEMGVALEHHYAKNSHHPEFYGKLGMRGMSLLDLIEMLTDWLAATQRHATGDIVKSVIINQKRFEYPDYVRDIFLNTLREFGIDVPQSAYINETLIADNVSAHVQKN